MFIRPCYRKKNGKRHAYWALVESYRTERGPRQTFGWKTAVTSAAPGWPWKWSGDSA